MTKAERRMTKPDGNAASQRKYDLEERSAKYGEDIIAFAKRVPVNLITTPLIPQLVESGTSVGSNYCEADDAGSKKEFLYRISLCKRESRESKHWLRMIVAAEPQLRDDAAKLWQEGKELNLIFSAIYRKKRGES